MTAPGLLLCLAVFAGLVFGGGLALVATAPLRADEKLCAGAAAALVALYLAAGGIYLAGWPPAACLALPAAAAVLGFARRRAIGRVLRDPAARGLFGGWLLAAGWFLGCALLVRNYSGLGSGTTGDWMEHYERARFFLAHAPLDSVFIWQYPLPARPPLPGLVTGVLLALTGDSYPYFQVFAVLENSLVLLPALLLARRLAPAPFPRLPGILLLNPLVVHNAVYPWTKLFAAFFVLAGLLAFIRGEETRSGAATAAAAAGLAAGLLTHYSAGPYIVVLAAAWAWRRRRDWLRVRHWGRLALPAAAGGALFGTWLAWSVLHFGWGSTLAANTAVAGVRGQPPAAVLAAKASNLFCTLVPHPFRGVLDALVLPHSPVVVLRDYAFALYQTNLWFALGSVGGPLVAWLLWRRWRASPPGGPGLPRAFWVWFVGGSALLGIAVNGDADPWGLVHICLQPLVVFGLALLAASWADLSRQLRRILVAGLAVDFVLGVALHLYVEHLDRPFALWLVDGGRSLGAADGPCLASNVLTKHLTGCTLLGDGPLGPPAAVAGALALLGAAALLAARRPAPLIA